MEKPIWGSIFHPSGMVWRPIKGLFLKILVSKGIFRCLFICIYKLSKPLLLRKCNGKWFSMMFLLQNKIAITWYTLVCSTKTKFCLGEWAGAGCLGWSAIFKFKFECLIQSDSRGSLNKKGGGYHDVSWA